MALEVRQWRSNMKLNDEIRNGMRMGLRWELFPSGSSWCAKLWNARIGLRRSRVFASRFEAEKWLYIQLLWQSPGGANLV